LYQEAGQPEAFFGHIFGENSEGWMVVFTGRQARLEDPNAPANQLKYICQTYYMYPKHAARAAADLLEASERGYDAYFGVHLYRESGNRLASNAVPTVSCLWMDEDEGGFPLFGPEPTAVVYSSNERRHLYWRLAHPVSVEWAVDMNRRLAHMAGGDMGKAGLATVLRAPGTKNYKRHPQVDEVTMESTGIDPWDPEVLDQATPPLTTPSQYGRAPTESYDGPVLELTEFLDGVAVLGEVADGLGVKLAITCPWLSEHSGGDKSGTYVGQRSSGALWFHCNHDHCYGRTWRNFRKKVGRTRHLTVRPTGYTGPALNMEVRYDG
jgi:hypothetical protein